MKDTPMMPKLLSSQIDKVKLKYTVNNFFLLNAWRCKKGILCSFTRPWESRKRPYQSEKL